MDLKVVFLAVCVCAFAVSYSQAGIPKCCLSIKMNVPKPILAKVERWHMQQSNGACDIHALVLQVKRLRTPICANPKLLPWVKKLKQPRKTF